MRRDSNAKARRPRFERRPMWRTPIFLAGLALIPILMVTIDGPLSAMMRSIDGEAKSIIDAFAATGDSKYSLIPTGVACILLTLLYLVDASTIRARILAWLAGACGFVFVAIAYSGILTNAIKIPLGRARPHVAESLNVPEFHPFAVGGSWHSFPSGHANTVFVIALAVGFFFPVLRRYLLVVAAGLAFCRVLQFRHFISDSLGGALLAVATTLWLRDLFAAHDIVFRRGPDGRVTFSAPGRLVARWLRHTLRIGRRGTDLPLKLQSAERGD